MAGSRKKQKSIEYERELSMNLECLAVALGVQLKEIRRWRSEGLISYPVTEQEFGFIVGMMTVIWGNHRALRCQLSRLSMQKREALIRTAELNDVEVVLYNEILRWKLQHPKRYLKFSDARNMLRARLPNGYVQLTSKKLLKAKKSANYEIAKAKRAGKLDSLCKQLGMKMEANGKAKRIRLPDPEKTSKSVDSSIESINVFAEEVKIVEAGKALRPALQVESTHNHSDLSEEDLKYLEQNFGDSVANAKKTLEGRRRKLSEGL